MFNSKFIPIFMLFWLTALQAIEWNGNWAFGCDFLNRDLANAQINVENCGGRCLSLPECTHFSWNGTNGGTCWMKYGNVSKSDAFEKGDSGNLCGVTRESSSISIKDTLQGIIWNGNWAFGCDFNNPDFANATIKGDQCAGLCLSIPRCTHFVHKSLNGGTCLMKYGNVSKSDAFKTGDSTMVCGVITRNSLQGITWNGNWAFGCDFNNYDLFNATIKGDLCSGLCLSTPRCTHFVHKFLNGGTCLMKYGNVSKSDAFETGDNTMVCGVITRNTLQGIIWNGNWAFGCDFNNYDLFNATIKGDLCAGLCLSTPRCTHFVHKSLNGGTCLMKYGNVSKSDAFETGDNTMVCGVITRNTLQGIIWNGNWAFGCDFNNYDFVNATIKGDLCSGLCLSTPRCTHFVHKSLNGGTCLMKYGNVSKSDAFETGDNTMVCGVITRKVLSNASIIAAAIIVPVIVVLIVLAVVVAFWICRKKKITIKNFNLKSLPIINHGNENTDKWEIFPNCIIFDKKVGQGAFGNVYIAKISSIVFTKNSYASQAGRVVCNFRNDSDVNVAVKLLKNDASQSEMNDFIEEINLMKEIGYHKNVLSIIGSSTISEPLCLLVEFMENGDLLNFLRDRRTKLIASELDGELFADIMFTQNYQKSLEKTETTLVGTEAITPNDLISFAWQVASGMEYLSDIKLVHRDLAARNVLVGADKNVKISDFGLTRRVNDELNYMSSNHRRLPVKWMSIEAIFNQMFTSYSDVWAFGVVLFEIVTLGGTPYPAISNHELLLLLKNGYRMDRPDNCSQIMFDHILHCWNEDPLLRPSFSELRGLFEEILSRGCHYFSFDIDEENEYYKTASFNSISSDSNDDAFEKEVLQTLIHVNSVKEMKKKRYENIEALKS